MEVTALSVGKSVLSGVLGYAKSAIAEEVALQLGVKQDQAFITDELEMMQSFMMEAHEERDDSKVVKTWVKQVCDTAYDVEDCLQDFAVRLDKQSWRRFPCTLLERHRAAKKMKKLRAKVEDVSKRNVRYRLIKGSGSRASASEQSNTIAAAIFGVDDARRAAKQDNQRVDLLKLINDRDHDLKVIAVWGTGGDIGQTSIIRAVYENPDIQSKFPGRAWIRVMHPFSPKGFVQSLVNQLHATKGVEVLLEAEKAEQDLAQEFNECVNEKRCLIVLNDLSTIEEWDQIKKFFRNNKKGSRIVVSTSQVEVASLCAGQESQASELKQLSADQTLYAFYDKVSEKGKDLVKPLSSSAVVPGEITDDQSKDADGKKVVRSLTHIRTSVGALEELIGRKKEITDIIELILNRDQQCQVISLWGMGGLGKTTLISGVYQSPKLSDKFEKCAFVTIMRPFNLAELLRSLAVRLHDQSSKEDLLDIRFHNNKSLASMGIEELTKCLSNILENKSCLIVLDDMSSIREWDLIKPVFHSMEKTSCIIVTTREENIANHCSWEDGTVHNLQVLEPEEALYLFSKKVFGETTYLAEQKNPELVKEARQILKKCAGLPLAIVVIGCFLANRPKTPEEWRRLNENISAELEMNPELGMINAVLEKSYDGLPYYLKSCFLYLSIFPEDYIISRRRLVRRWAAENYSTERRGRSDIETADNYFMELNNRSMTLPSLHSVDSRKSMDSCKVHDLMREIAISKAMEENLVFRLEEGCSINTHGTIRHMAVSSNWKGDQNEFESAVNLTRIRSLSVFGEFRPFFISDKMRFLRVLDLEGAYGLDYHDLDNIGKLLHLKYLSLRGCRCTLQLPDSIGKLGQLQTLDIRDTYIMFLPKTIINLQKLQYIHAGNKSEYVAEEATGLMTRCVELLEAGSRLCASCCVPSILGVEGFKRRDVCTATSACCMEIPALMRGLVDQGGAWMPRGIRKLKGLHTLRVVNVGRGNSVLQDIKMLTGLRKLGVIGLNKKNGVTFCSVISDLNRLQSLFVRAAGKPGLHGCLDGISLPPENLQSLKLYGNLETLPEWIMKLQHLVKLKLKGTELSNYDASMEFLGKLPKLEILGLGRLSFMGEELHFHSPQTDIAFGSLRVLRIAEIKSVMFEAGSMPNLEQLEMTSEIKDKLCVSGLEFLPSMKEVKFIGWIPFDWKMTRPHDSETRDKMIEEHMHEERRKVGEFRMKIQEQLARNPNQPILI
ncbi:unnamed protein product [Urochloa decumbens]|uniref:Uncharacterized protein n=1 Tax=Urochloa decumbens TaxID=240449 RepID=A0ABC9AUX8_9POAL